MMQQEYEEEKKFVLRELADHHKPRNSKESWYAEDLTKHFKDDIEVMTACIPFHPAVAASTASPRILDDKKFAFELVKEEATFIRFLSDRLKDDIEVVQRAVWSYAPSLADASERIRSTPACVAICCADSLSPLNKMHESIKNDPAKFLELLNEIEPHHKPSVVIHYASQEIQDAVGTSDPIPALKAYIFHKKLNSNLAPKARRDGPKMKI